MPKARHRTIVVDVNDAMKVAKKNADKTGMRTAIKSAIVRHPGVGSYSQRKLGRISNRLAGDMLEVDKLPKDFECEFDVRDVDASAIGEPATEPEEDGEES